MSLLLLFGSAAGAVASGAGSAAGTATVVGVLLAETDIVLTDPLARVIYTAEIHPVVLSDRS